MFIIKLFIFINNWLISFILYNNRISIFSVIN